MFMLQMILQLMANGQSGDHGPLVPRHVVEASKSDAESVPTQHLPMEEKIVQVSLRKQKVAILRSAKV